MTEFPIHVYQSPGNYVSKGYRYKLTSAADQAALDALLADGWHMTLKEAIDAAGDAAKFNRPRADWKLRRSMEAKAKAQRLKDRKASIAAHEARKAAPKKAAKPVEAPAEVPDDNAPPTRAELEQQAVKLGVRFRASTSDERLLERINEAMKEA